MLTFAELANQRQTTFLSTPAHELRNPIASITVASTVMRGLEAGSPKLGRLVDIVGRQSSHMVRLVDDLLDVSRISLGRLTLQCQPLKLVGILESALAAALPVIGQRLQKVQLDLPEENATLLADHVRVVQLFVNLLINASKFSPPATKVYMAATIKGAMVEVKVRDRGKGMAADDMARMFDLFEQGPDEVGHTLHGGLGIGLSLVRSIATMHGGSVSVASAGVGQGCEFTVLLPLHSTPEGTTRAELVGAL